MVFKKAKSIIIMPIIFITIFLIAIISMIIYLNKNEVYIIFVGVAVPLILEIVFIIYLILLVNEPSEKFTINENEIVINNFSIKLNDVDYVTTNQGFMSVYYPDILIVLKNKDAYKITHVVDAFETVKLINRKYLKKK